jgi:catechol 2,3-dioxygenase-like lactoylglutathione lyase family enzyme
VNRFLALGLLLGLGACLNGVAVLGWDRQVRAWVAPALSASTRPQGLAPVPPMLGSRTARGVSPVHGVATTAQAHAVPALVGSTREAALFHHLHLVTGQTAFFADFYARLFAPRSIVRGVFWEVEGVRGDDVFLLLSPMRPPPHRQRERATAIWHFGWGQISVGETYVQHLINEVNWKPPYNGLTAGFHVHLRSHDPVAAAAWYEAALGAIRVATLTPAEDTAASGPDAEVPPPNVTGEPPIPSSSTSAAETESDAGPAEVIVRLGKIALVIHRTEAELLSTREAEAVDHLSFLVSDVKAVTARAREAGIPIVDQKYDLPDVPSVMIEGPDRIVLELLERPKGPGFWHDLP